MNLIKIRFYLFALRALVFLGSCQEEDNTVIDPNDNTESFNGDSVLANMLLSTSQNDGTSDNLLDGTSCFSIVYPVDVLANGQQVTLESNEDLSVLRNIFSQFANDTDFLDLIFPVTLMSENFMTQMVPDLSSFNALVASCINDIPDTYSCLGLQFPITGATYNAANEQIGTFAINDELTFYNYLLVLNSDTYVTFDFPIYVTDGSGSPMVVNANTELVTVLDQVDCTLSDDPVVISNNGANSVIEELTSGHWFVNLLEEDDGEDETCDFVAYTFVFAIDGSVGATSSSRDVSGTWQIQNSSSGFDLVLDFEMNGTEDPFEELNDDWDVLAYDQDSIELQDVSGGNGGVDRLNFGRNPYAGCVGTGPETLIGRWLYEESANLGNTMYEFLNGLRYTYYCENPNGLCDQAYWESRELSDALPNPNEYTFDGTILTIDLNFGNYFVSPLVFECQGDRVDFEDPEFPDRYDWVRLGADLSNCD